jgi:hypothetical protein
VIQCAQAADRIVGHSIDVSDHIGWFPALQHLLYTEYMQETELVANFIYHRRDHIPPT